VAPSSSSASPPRFTVVTSAAIESGSILAYLVETTGLRVDRIYFDTMEQFRNRPGMPQNPARWYRSGRRLRQHLGLARAMPRHYFFKGLQAATGISQLEFLLRLERLSPRLLQAACGFALPARPADRPLLRKITDVAAELAVPLIRTPSLNSDETVARFSEEAPDIVIGLGTRILSARLLATARIGFLNAHASLLPDYRGGTTEFWQLVHGERVTGVTIHWMAARVDEGAICAQKAWPIPDGFDHHRLRLLSLFNGFDVWREVVDRLLHGEMSAAPQTEARTPTFRVPSIDQEFDFYRRGLRPGRASGKE
jgi:hypothetical protein